MLDRSPSRRQRRRLQHIVELVEEIIAAGVSVLPHRAALIGISGIDGSGKSFVTAQTAKQLRELGGNVAALTVDDWHNPLPLDGANPAADFYKRGFRLPEMFRQLVIPLKQRGSVELIADNCHATSATPSKQCYSFSDIDIVLLEGIFLFQPAYADEFDLTVWIDCSFETALQRAVRRGQEHLSALETQRAFETIYFPAQRLHFERDHPRDSADLILVNEK